MSDFYILSSRPHHRIAASLYTPTKSEKPPGIIVMGHGIGAIKSAGLEPFSTAFSKAGYAALTFDYLHYGQSDGQPRNIVSVAQELRDFKDVLAWVRDQPDRFDRNRIVVWGSSFGGMHVTALMAEDHQLAAGIAQCPCVDGLAAALKTPFLASLYLGAMAVTDWLISFIREKPIYVPLVSDGSTPAFMTGDEVMRGWDRLVPDETVDLPNTIAARTIFSLISHRPVNRIHRSKKPLLVVLPSWDNQAPLGAAEKVVKKAPLGEGVRVPGGHFDLYKGGPAFEKNLDAQLEFLGRVI